MTETTHAPIAFTGDGQPIFPAQIVPAGHPQPLGVLSDGRPVWPVAPGAGPIGQPEPLGVLPDGTFLFAPVGLQGMATATATVKPLWKKKRVLIPAGVLALAVIGSAAGGDNKKEITPSANSGTTTTAPAKSEAELAAEKAAADKAAADQAAADKAAAAKAAADKAAADKAAAAAEAAKKGPRDEQALLRAVVEARDAYEGTDNELKQRQAQRQRSSALRAAVPSMRVTNWVGEIRTIDTNGEGKAVLELNIGDDTKLGTWNNAFSDFEEHTLIPMDSAMYETLVNMKEGDRIRFSGTFFRDDEQGLKEKSITFEGQMQTPNFVFRFSSISAV